MKYQLSANGTDWKYYSGSWITATGSVLNQTNTASEISAHITSFSTGGHSIYVKAFLVSDGSQQVSIDHIDISYATGSTSTGSTS
ncbi:MAG: hypothetical protein H6767_00460 [Candidatus Peribacteria bacterium]|nr:MAG: hypothetical protein H6767_00460 [Candidatus Peribacteria bacterium]